ncbi:MAG TPA: MBL fold metallo-hydrolase [Solirubrobacteraceae bacterium]|jgi:glyoxylase-like metal-dependent hydrolase (beta-lactamase superfamily II)/predicted ester cyclase|nr:MBL fold metallo-hydrolase [Solirubrobacteraceae bacterium]
MAGTSTSSTAAELMREYFASIGRDPEAQRRWYADDARVTLAGAIEDGGKAEVVAFFDGLYAAFPDLRMEALEVVGEGDTVAVHWRLRGTFAGPERFNGIEPTGARLDLRGVDVITVRDGRIVRNDAYTDNMAIARQLGMMPPLQSPAEQRMTAAFNARTSLARRLLTPHGDPEEVADGVWRVQGQPGRCNVYLVRDGDGVLMFDAGARTMRGAVAAAAARLGGLTRIVLGHGHTDHRGTAPAFDVPVLCHPDEVVDAEGSGGWRYWDRDLSFLPPPQRQLHKLFHARMWDGGPVKVAGTVSEGDDVAGFEVVHLPGHAPGMIALWRASDRVALSTDAFYVLDMWGRDTEPHLPLPGYNHDHEQARASLRKLAALDPAACHPGHANALTGDVRARLERAAAE